MLVTLCFLFCTGCGSDSSSSSNSSSDSKSAKELDTTKLSIGTGVELNDGLEVTVLKVKTGLKNYDGKSITRVKVRYVNNGKEGASYNTYDWKGQNKKGTQTRSTYYSKAKNELNSGTLAAGGKITANIYFKGTTKKILYYENELLDREASLTWVVK